MPTQNGSARNKTVAEKPGKSKATEVARVELRASGGLHGSEKPGWSAGGKEKVARKLKNLQ